MSGSGGADAPLNKGHAKLAGLPNEQQQQRQKRPSIRFVKYHHVDSGGHMTHNRRVKKLREEFQRGACDNSVRGSVPKRCISNAPVLRGPAAQPGTVSTTVRRIRESEHAHVPLPSRTPRLRFLFFGGSSVSPPSIQAGTEFFHMSVTDIKAKAWKIPCVCPALGSAAARGDDNGKNSGTRVPSPHSSLGHHMVQ